MEEEGVHQFPPLTDELWTQGLLKEEESAFIRGTTEFQ